MPPRRLDPREIDHLRDVVEERISKNVKEYFIYEIEEVKANFRSKMALMKSYIFSTIMSALGGVPWHVGTEGSYEEVVEELEVFLIDW